MKAKILKHLGLTEKQFYKKYKTPADFENSKEGKTVLAKYGKTIPKAQTGINLGANNFNVPDTNAWMQNQNMGMSQIDQIKMNPYNTQGFNTQAFSTQMPQQNNWDATTPKSGGGEGGGLLKGLDVGSKLVEGIQGLFEEKKQMKKADQWNQVSELTLEASQTRPKENERRYVRPEDMMGTGEEFFPIQGTGTNILAKNGKKIPKANFGAAIGQAAGNKASGTFSNWAAKEYDFNAGTQIGGAVGDGIGMINPVAGMIAKPMLTAIGGALDPYAAKIKQYTEEMNNNIDNMAMTNGAQGLQQKHTSFMQDGGYIDSIPTPNLVEDADYQLIPMNSTFDGSRSFRKKGPTYLDESKSIDAKILKLNKIKKPNAKHKGELLKLNNQKEDLMTHQIETAELQDGGNLYNKKPMTRKTLDEQHGNIRDMYEGEDDMITGTPPIPSFPAAKGAKAIKAIKDFYTNAPKASRALDAAPSLSGYLHAAKLPATAGAVYGASDIISNDIGMINREGTKLSLNPRFSNARRDDIDRLNKGLADGGSVDATMNGDLQLYDGNAEVISQNPYLPDGGETIKFNGPSHAEGGMDVAYGGNPVNVEGGEPAVKLGDENLVVFGNLSINDEFSKMLGDKNAKGKKFKNYMKDLSVEEDKYSKLSKKSLDAISQLDMTTGEDKLTMSSHKMNAKAADQRLKDIAVKKTKSALLQEAINSTAEENGLEANALAKGRVKKAKKGATIPKAQDGKTVEGEIPIPKKNPDVDEHIYEMMVGFYNRAMKQGKGDVVDAYQDMYEKYYPEEARRIMAKEVPSNAAIEQGITSETLQNPDTPLKTITGTNDDRFGFRTRQMYPNLPEWEGTRPTEFEEIPYNKREEQESLGGGIPVDDISYDPTLIDVINSALPYFRPTDAEDLDPRQLAGEMNALATNQLEPVQAQGYQPDLDVPYDISMQDRLNEITARDKESSKLLGYNPAAESMVAGQSYGAKSQVLADQFRANQAKKDQVYSKNRAVTNQAKLQNLGIFDQQFQRQSQAKSNTKAVQQAALNSISGKYLQNQLENKTLQTYENMYNYRYGKNMRAQNWNGLAQFNIPTVGSTSQGRYSQVAPEGQEYLYTEDGEVAKMQTIPKSRRTARNGSIVSAMKRI